MSAQKRKEARARRQLLRFNQRLAWRDIRAHKKSSALILALVLIPMMGLSWFAVMQESQKFTDEAKIESVMGQAKAVLRGMVGPDGGENTFACTQEESAMEGEVCVAGTQRTRGTASLADVAHAQGYRVVPIRALDGDISCTVDGRQRTTTVTGLRQLDASDPVARGLATLLQGRWPRADGEIAIGYQGCHHVGLGGTVQWEGKTLRVVGLAKQGDGGGLVGPQFPVSSRDASPSYFLAGEQGVTRELIAALNDVGFFVKTRGTQARNMTSGASGMSPDHVSHLLLGAFVTLEVAMVSAAAFAIGVRRQRRQVGLLATVGAEPKHMVASVVWKGVWLGVLGSLAGVVLGAIAGLATVLFSRAWAYKFPALDTLADRFNTVSLPWAVLVLLFAMGAISSLVAAILPGLAATRVDALTSMRAADAASRPPRRPLWGIGVLVASLVTMGLFIPWARVSRVGDPSFDRASIYAGIVIVLTIGILLCLPWLLSLLNRLTVGPLALRMAVRSMARHLRRSVPSVAAVLVVSALAGAAAFVMTQQLGFQAREEARQPPQNLVMVRDVLPPRQADVERELLAIVAGNKVVERAQVLDFNGAITTPERVECRHGSTPGCQSLQEIHSRVISGPDAARAALRRDLTSSEKGALDRGEALVVDSPQARILHGGHITLERNEQTKDFPAQKISDAPTWSVGTVIMAEQVVRAWEVPSQGMGYKEYPALSPVSYFWLERPLTYVETGKLQMDRSVVEKEGEKLYFQAPQIRNPLDVWQPWIAMAFCGLLALLVAGLTSALAASDRTDDLATLSAAGAAPSTRKLLAGWTMFLYCFGGAALGMTLGVGAAWGAMLMNVADVTVAFPWALVGADMVVIPLMGALIAMAVTPSRLPMLRRRT